MCSPFRWERRSPRLDLLSSISYMACGARLHAPARALCCVHVRSWLVRCGHVRERLHAHTVCVLPCALAASALARAHGMHIGQCQLRTPPDALKPCSYRSAHSLPRCLTPHTREETSACHRLRNGTVLRKSVRSCRCMCSPMWCRASHVHEGGWPLVFSVGSWRHVMPSVEWPCPSPCSACPSLHARCY